MVVFRHLECLRYVHEHGCEWNKGACLLASVNGHLECLKYAHEHGCKWDAGICMWAARNGHLQCLKYDHEHGCPINIQQCLNISIGLPLIQEYLQSIL